MRKIISLLSQMKSFDQEEVKILLANRPKQERLKLLKDIENFMQYIGYAGEFRVMSEFLVRGVNAMNPRVDNGFDLMAIREEETFFIQVKTAFLGKEGMFSFNVQETGAGVEYEGKRRAFFIFVLVSGEGEKMNFLILPQEEFQKQVKAGNIWVSEATKRYKLKIYLREGKAYLGKTDNDVSGFLDGWDLFLNSDDVDADGVADRPATA